MTAAALAPDDISAQRPELVTVTSSAQTNTKPATKRRRRKTNNKRKSILPTPAFVNGERLLFCESVRFEDALPPFQQWQPTPRQIAEWSAIIRAENELRKLAAEGDSDDEQ